MAAIVAVSNLSYGDRSVSFSAVSSGAGDTLAWSVVAAALTSAGVLSSTIKSFLSTSHTDAAGTLAALALQGAVVSEVTSAAAATVIVGGDNSFTVGAAGTVAIRIALAASITA
jgi:hypothetical protein